MKMFGVPKSQWDEMAKHNDYDQVKLWATTRARLMELELIGRKPASEPIKLFSVSVDQQLELKAL